MHARRNPDGARAPAVAKDTAGSEPAMGAEARATAHRGAGSKPQLEERAAVGPVEKDPPARREPPRRARAVPWSACTKADWGLVPWSLPARRISPLASACTGAARPLRRRAAAPSNRHREGRCAAGPGQALGPDRD